MTPYHILLVEDEAVMRAFVSERLNAEGYRVSEAENTTEAEKLVKAKQPDLIVLDILLPDGLLEPFAEHHGLLQGMIEIYFKNDYPAEFKRIISITYAFSAGWRMIHNPEAKRDVADNLSTTEFTVAMLYSRGWSYKEIAGHLQISVESVQRHIGNIFDKVGVHDKDQLSEFVLL